MSTQSINFRFYSSLFIIILCATIFLNTSAFSEEFIRVVDRNGIELLTVRAIGSEDNQYLFINDLLKIFRAFDERQKVRIFDAKQRYIPLTQKLTLELKDSKKLSLSINQTKVTAEGFELATKPAGISLSESYTLSKPPLLISDKPALPIEFLTQVLAKVLEIDIEFDQNIQTLWLRLSTNDKGLAKPIQTLTKRDEQFLVIIDAGHGGSDIGTKSPTGLLEKELTLAIAQKVKQLCEDGVTVSGSRAIGGVNHRENGIAVHLTRESDQFLTSQQRASIANMNYGDLFISIHSNASFSSNQSGFKIYINNPAGMLKSIAPKIKPATNATEMNRKPRASVNEFKTLTTTSSQSSQLVKAISQTDFIEQSRKLAENLLVELRSAGLVGKPPIEIPLATLDSVYMPAVLLEVGYLSNASDEAKLSDPKFIETISQSLFAVLIKRKY